MVSGEMDLQGSSGVAGGARCRMSVTGPEIEGRAGLSGCAQFDSAKTTFISARRSTKSPGRLRLAFQRKRPFSSTETDAKNVTHGGMSRKPSPTLAAAARKFSCGLRDATPKAASVEAGVEPPTVECG